MKLYHGQDNVYNCHELFLGT